MKTTHGVKQQTQTRTQNRQHSIDLAGLRHTATHITPHDRFRSSEDHLLLLRFGITSACGSAACGGGGGGGGGGGDESILSWMENDRFGL